MDENERKEIECQVDTYKEGPFNIAIMDKIWIETKDLIRKAKQLFSGARLSVKRSMGKSGGVKSKDIPKSVKTLNLQKGERVRVKSEEEIKKTLDDEGKLQGCAFTKYMWPACGQEMVVFKRVDTFLNETNNKIQKISDTVLLENSFCTGERRFGEVCDRSCFIFWKEAWLERIPE